MIGLGRLLGLELRLQADVGAEEELLFGVLVDFRWLLFALSSVGLCLGGLFRHASSSPHWARRRYARIVRRDSRRYGALKPVGLDEL